MRHSTNSRSKKLGVAQKVQVHTILRARIAHMPTHWHHANQEWRYSAEWCIGVLVIVWKPGHKFVKHHFTPIREWQPPMLIGRVPRTIYWSTLSRSSKRVWLQGVQLQDSNSSLHTGVANYNHQISSITQWTPVNVHTTDQPNTMTVILLPMLAK